MLSRRLQRRGYEVVTAVDGESGLALAKSETPDLVLMDMSLPVHRRLGGDAAAQGRPATRAHPRHRADRARDGGRPGAGPRGRLRRLRHQAHRPRPPARENRGSARGQGEGVSKRRGKRGSGIPEPTKRLAAENAALRRTLRREVAQRKRLRKDLGQETARRGEAEAALAEAQSHDRAASEILQVISASPTDVQPVFDAIIESAARLCAGVIGGALPVRWAAPRRRGNPQHRPRRLGGAAPRAPRAADPRQSRGTGRARPRARPSPGRDGRPRVPISPGGRGRLAQRRVRPDDARRPSPRRHQRGARRGPPLLAAGDRAARDVRRPGRHRDRERAPVRGAGAAQPRNLDRGAGAADRDRRDPAGDRRVADRRCSRSSTPSPQARAAALRRRQQSP